MATSTKTSDFIPPPNLHTFSVGGKAAIVTGAGSGINLCFASLLLSQNCNVLFADLALRPEAQKVVDAYSSKNEGKPKAAFVQTDVRDWKQLSHMFEVADKEFGGVDIVCPGAGIHDPHWSNFWHPPGSGASKDSSDGGCYASLDINITHPIRTTQLAIATFLNPSQGEKVSPTNPKRVVIISSIAGQLANLNTPLYIAGKHAMNGFIRSLGMLDSKLGIRVNGVALGLVKTPLWTDHPEKFSLVDQDKDVWATPEEVAEVMVRCLEDPEIGGGTILEVVAGQTRKVAILNDPGPSGPGRSVSNTRARCAQIFEWLGEDGWGQMKL